MRLLAALLGILCLLGVLLISGCDPDRMAGISFPALSDFEPSVQKQLADAKKDLRSSLDKAGDDNHLAGSAFGKCAMIHHAYQLLGTASSCYRKAVELEPKEPRWHYLLARVQRVRQKFDESEQLLRKTLELKPGDLPTQIALGELLYDLDRFDASREIFTTVRSGHPLCVPAISGLGRIALAQEDAETAVELLTRALELSPASSALRYPLGLALRKTGEREKALEEMGKRGIAIAKVNDPWLEEVRKGAIGWRLHLNRGATFFQEGRWKDAEIEFQKALAIETEDASVRTNLGSSLVKLGRREDARVQFEQAIRINPDAALTWFNLGVIDAASGEDDRAVERYQRALDLQPNLHDARFNLANSLRRLKRFVEAKVEYRKVTQARPGDGSAWFAGGLCSLRLEKREEALVTFEAGILASPGDHRIENAICRLLSTSGDGAMASRALEISSRLLNLSKSLDHVESQAMALAAAGRFEEAIAWQERCLEVARTAELSGRISFIEGNLEIYRRGEPARLPWPLDSELLSPSFSD